MWAREKVNNPRHCRLEHSNQNFFFFQNLKPKPKKARLADPLETVLFDLAMSLAEQQGIEDRAKAAIALIGSKPPKSIDSVHPIAPTEEETARWMAYWDEVRKHPRECRRELLEAVNRYVSPNDYRYDQDDNPLFNEPSLREGRLQTQIGDLKVLIGAAEAELRDVRRRLSRLRREFAGPKGKIGKQKRSATKVAFMAAVTAHWLANLYTCLGTTKPGEITKTLRAACGQGPHRLATTQLPRIDEWASWQRAASGRARKPRFPGLRRATAVSTALRNLAPQTPTITATVIGDMEMLKGAFDP